MPQQICWITGASTGIGAALAKRLAREGYTVAASARSADKLEALATEISKTGATPGTMRGSIKSFPLDVTDAEATKITVAKIISEFGRIDLAIFCAGTYIPDNLAHFDAEAIGKQFSLNVMGTVHALDAVLPSMKTASPKTSRHIAVVASVAGYRGLPGAIGYGGTKAALINMCEAMKPECDLMGIKFQLICPGFVKTPLTDKNTFPMPFLIPVDQAVDSIIKGLAANRFEIVFPMAMKVTMKFLRLLPYALLFPITRKLVRQR